MNRVTMLISKSNVYHYVMIVSRVQRVVQVVQMRRVW